MKEGKCFRCRKAGHLSRDCPEKQGGQKKEEPKKKMDGKQLHAHVRAIFKEMTPEDCNQFLEEAEKTGF